MHKIIGTKSQGMMKEKGKVEISIYGHLEHIKTCSSLVCPLSSVGIYLCSVYLNIPVLCFFILILHHISGANAVYESKMYLTGSVGGYFAD